MENVARNSASDSSVVFVVLVAVFGAAMVKRRGYF